MVEEPDNSAPTAPQVDLVGLDALIELALAEDLTDREDITTLCANLSGTAEAHIEARAPGLFAGQAVLPRLLEKTAPKVRIQPETLRQDGTKILPDQHLACLTGPIEQVLASERTILNFLQRLCGIATLTAQYVDALRGTKAKIYDTRKTIPGWRSLDKYAVRCGGGCNHRFGLFDAVLAKDNHFAGVPPNELPTFLRDLAERARNLHHPVEFVQVEVSNIEMLAKILPVEGIDVILLDNFPPKQLHRAVEMRNQAGLQSKVELEASGGITLRNIRRYAETGIERISVGAITHSAAALDLAMEIEGLPQSS